MFFIEALIFIFAFIKIALLVAIVCGIIYAMFLGLVRLKDYVKYGSRQKNTKKDE